MHLDAATVAKLEAEAAALVDATQCPRCHGPRDSHSGCDHCREQRITDVQPRPEVLR